LTPLRFGDARHLRAWELMAAADTIIGPVFLALAPYRSKQRFYVAIGKTF